MYNPNLVIKRNLFPPGKSMSQQLTPNVERFYAVEQSVFSNGLFFVSYSNFKHHILMTKLTEISQE